MASFWTKLADVITPWDRGGERKRREEEAARRQQATIVRPTAQPVVDTNPRQNQTIGGQPFNLLGSPNNSVSVPVRQEYDMGRVDQGLDAGKSWEDIARETGTDLNTVREYSQRTRPEYGIPNKATPQVASNPRLGTPGEVSLPFFEGMKPQSQIIKEKTERGFNDWVNEQAKFLQDNVHKKSTGRTIAELADPTGLSSLDDFRGLDNENPLAHEIAIARNIGVTLPELTALRRDAPEEVAEIEEQLRKAKRLTEGASTVSTFLSLTPLRGAAVATRQTTMAGIRAAINNLLTKAGAKAAAKTVAKKAAIGAGAGATLDTGAQYYMTGEVDPLQTLKSAAQGAFFTATDPFDLIPSNKPFRNSFDVNTNVVEVPTRVSDDIDVPAYQRRPKRGSVDIEARANTPENQRTALQHRQDLDNVVREAELELNNWINDNPGATRAEYDTKVQEIQDEVVRKTNEIKARRHAEITGEEIEPPRETQDIPVDDEVGAPAVRAITKTDRTAEKTQQAAEQPNFVINEGQGTTNGMPDAPTTNARQASRIPQNDAEVLRGLFESNVREDLTGATLALRKLRETRRTENSERFARAAAAAEEVRKAGGSWDDQQRARYGQLRGALSEAGYRGSDFDLDSDAGRVLNRAIDAQYGSQVATAGNVKKSFERLFRYGTENNEYADTIQPSDIRNVRDFFNEILPDARLGNDVEKAIRDLGKLDLKDPGTARKVLGFQRALLFSADLGTLFRQTLPTIFNNPTAWGKGTKAMFRNIFSEKGTEKLIRSIETDPIAQYGRREGLDLTILSGGEDYFRNNEFTQKVPGVKQLVNVSERAFDIQTNVTRLEAFKSMVKQFGGIEGVEEAARASGDRDAFMRAITRQINTDTGRGQFAKLGAPNAHFLSEVFNSPRGLAARLSRINPLYYRNLYKTNKYAFKKAIQSLVLQTAVTTAALAAAAEEGLYEDGKIRVGDTRIDISGGVSTMLKTVNDVRKLMTGEEETTPFNKSRDKIVNWFTNQMTPAINTAFELFGYHPKDGEMVNEFGESFNPVSAAVENISPLVLGGLYNDMFQEGTSGAQSAANFAMNMVGFGVNTYRSSDDKKQDANEEVLGSIGRLAQYVPEGEDATTDKVMKGALDRAYYEGDWGAYADGWSKQAIDAQNDPNITKKELDKIKLERKRAVFYNTTEGITPELIDQYKDIGVELWQKMGDPDSKEYNPELHQMLGALDAAMAEKGISYNSQSGKGSKFPKYYKKSSGSGRKGISGSIKGSSFGSYGTAPDVQQYDMTGLRTGLNTEIPVIRRIRPNIVHKITKSG